MYRVAVCDDDKTTTEETAALIREWDSSIWVECFYSGEELLKDYSSYHAVFLD